MPSLTSITNWVTWVSIGIVGRGEFSSGLEFALAVLIDAEEGLSVIAFGLFEFF